MTKLICFSEGCQKGIFPNEPHFIIQTTYRWYDMQG